MLAKARKIALLAGVLGLATAAAKAQPADPIADLLQSAPPEAPVEAAQVVHAAGRALSASDIALLRRAIDSARRGDVNGARSARDSLSDPLAKKVAEWALADSDGDSLGFYEIDNARHELAEWPRGQRRELAAERQLEASGKPPAQIVAWFEGDEPETPQGAMALASAYQALGKPADAQALIKHWWRDKAFDAETQRTMLSRFAGLLTQDDQVRRVDILLYEKNTQAARDLFPLIPADQQQAAEARLALRANAGNANELAGSLPASVANAPGVAFEKAAYYRRHNLESLAQGLVANFPHEAPTPEMAKQLWEERRLLMNAALRVGDMRAAYAAADSGMTIGPQAAESEFFAGWIALTKLKDAESAAKHFATLDRVGASPITRARALYWEGRAAEAKGDKTTADSFYQAAAAHGTTFYGQLAMEKVGLRLTLASDPEVTPADRARFEDREPVQAARLLYELGYRDLYRSFVLSLDDVLPSTVDEALLIDMVRGYGDQYLSMLVARSAAQHGFILPQRAYPYRAPPQVAGGPEAAFVLAITRQESGFDPNVRSAAGARGLMQVEPTTGAWLARKIGVSFSADQLYEADYNMRIGSRYLGELVDQFSGSYIMAAAAYNAGPGRPRQWVSWCGDPRGASDPVDFIECIPFSQTRDYVMRVMEGVQIYRAKMSGGTAPITLHADLRRGAYGFAAAQTAASATLTPVVADR